MTIVPVKRLMASDPEHQEINRLMHVLAVLKNRHLFAFDPEISQMPEAEWRAAIAETEQRLQELLLD